MSFVLIWQDISLESFGAVQTNYNLVVKIPLTVITLSLHPMARKIMSTLSAYFQNDLPDGRKCPQLSTIGLVQAMKILKAVLKNVSNLNIHLIWMHVNLFYYNLACLTKENDLSRHLNWSNIIAQSQLNVACRVLYFWGGLLHPAGSQRPCGAEEGKNVYLPSLFPLGPLEPVPVI